MANRQIGWSQEEILLNDILHQIERLTQVISNGGGSGTVTSVSVVSANGFAGSVATATTTPAITLSTTVTGLLKGDGTAISAAVAGTDYFTSGANTVSSNTTFTGTTNTLNLVGIKVFIGGSTTPTALLHLAAGTATAGTSPLKFTSGPLMTTPEAGTFEYDSATNSFKFSVGTTAANRLTLMGLVSGGIPTINRIPFAAGSAGYNDSGNLTFVTNRLLGTTLYLTVSAGTATAGTAPIKMTSGTNLTTAEAGAFEYNGTNLFFTRTGTTRQTVLTANVITTETIVSDTSVTVNIAGTDYKLLARA